MSQSIEESEEQNRVKIQSLISLYEKSSSLKEPKSNAISHKLSTRISDFAWPEREVSHTPKHAAEIVVSDYVSVKNLINVYQQISQYGPSPVVCRKDSFTKMKKNDASGDMSYDQYSERQTSNDSAASIKKTYDDQQLQETSPLKTPQGSHEGKVSFAATSGLFDSLSLTEEEVDAKSRVLRLSPYSEERDEEFEYNEESYPGQNGFSPLPDSYSAIRTIDGCLNLILPSPKSKSNIKSKSRKNGKVNFIEEPTLVIETYNVYEYERGDESLDPVSSSAQYEIEKKTEKLDKFKVNLIKGGKGLGLSIVGIGLGSETGEERLGIYIKALTSGGVAETAGSLRVQDQILEVDGVSLVGVSQKFAAETLKATGQTVQFLIGRETTQGN